LQRKVFGALDGLRCVSVVAVVWHHCNDEFYRGLLATGFTGVYLFFAISGFLITTLLLRERDRNGEISLRNFYIRRTLRIFPLYYAVVLLYLALILLMDRHSAGGRNYLHNLPFFLTYTSNWFIEVGAPARIVFYHGWSLATEEQFYLLWPWVVRYAKSWQAPVALMTALVVGDQLGERAVLRGLLDGNALWVRIFTSIATPICLGCLFAYLLHQRRGFRLAYAVLGSRLAAPLVALVVVLCLGFDSKPWLLLNFSLATLVATCCLREDHLLMPLLRLPPVRYLGSISYGIYLLHVFAMNVAQRVLHLVHPVPTFLVALPVAILLGGFSYRYFERWFLQRKERYSSARPLAGEPLLRPAGLTDFLWSRRRH
jgi:peptidoglycan/LPS O-acetylase OafA/YrhL